MSLNNKITSAVTSRTHLNATSFSCLSSVSSISCCRRQHHSVASRHWPKNVHRCSRSKAVPQRRTMVVGSGKFARMMDLGATPSASNTKASTSALNLNKNCHLQAIVFDFHVLTQSLHKQKPETSPSSITTTKNSAATTSSSSTLANTQSAATSNMDRIKEAQALFQVGRKKQQPQLDSDFDIDDLSGILDPEEEVTAPVSSIVNNTPPAKTTDTTNSTAGSSIVDVRAKYAKQLRDKVQQSHGSASLESLDHITSSGKKDVNSGAAAIAETSAHLFARQRAMQAGSKSTKRWMAGTGTGVLLRYLHQRNIRLGLLGRPMPLQKQEPTVEASYIKDFLSQMKTTVSFHTTIQDSSDDESSSAAVTMKRLLQQAANSILDPTTTSGVKQQSAPTPSSSAVAVHRFDRCMVVSDCQHTLRAAKDVGCITVQVRSSKNVPRGNISCHYEIANIDETRGIINTINGISYNTVLQ